MDPLQNRCPGRFWTNSLPLLFVVLLPGMTGFFGCGPNVKQASELPKQQHLNSARKTVQVQETTLTGKLFIWQNKMPGIGSSTPIAKVTLRTGDDSDTLPADIHAVQIYFTRENEAWIPRHNSDPDLKGKSKHVWTLRDGPSWKAGTSVQAFMSFQTGKDDTTYLKIGASKIKAVH